MITLHWSGRSNFWVLLDPRQSVRWHLWMWRIQLVNLVSAGTGKGMGCVCGWQYPVAWRWPGWFWLNRIWDRHVLTDCPLDRRSPDG
jgi:hypothetical protein